jgi:hypothetical protein
MLYNFRFTFIFLPIEINVVFEDFFQFQGVTIFMHVVTVMLMGCVSFGGVAATKTWDRSIYIVACRLSLLSQPYMASAQTGYLVAVTLAGKKWANGFC